MTVTGPGFFALQVRDLEDSAHFYESLLGLPRAVFSPPQAVVFDTSPVPFAVREPLPGVDLASITPHPGAGVALWFFSDGIQELHDELSAAGVNILNKPTTGPFGLTFTFADPNGYAITVHDKK